MPALSLLYSPFPSMESARRAAKALLDANLAACCNLLPGMESHYIWEGKPTQSAEILLLCKTTPSLASAAQEQIKALHPYDCPAILLLPVKTNKAFHDWALAQLSRRTP